MKLKYIMASFLIGSCTFISSCKDDFADINTNPTIVSKPDPRYLFTQALANLMVMTILLGITITIIC